MRGPQHEFCAKMKFPAQKNKNSSVNGTTSLAVIVGPKCLIAHLLAPHDRAFSHWGNFIVQASKFCLVIRFVPGGADLAPNE